MGLFHRHVWSRWVDAGDLKIGQRVVGVAQERRCTKCNKVRLRKTRIDL